MKPHISSPGVPSTSSPSRPGRRPPTAARLRRRRPVLSGVGLATALGLLLAPAFLASSSSAGSLAFPYTDDFSTAAGGTLSGDAQVVGGRLRLTDAVPSQAGAWSTDDTFASDLGLDIEFDYAMHHDGPTVGADGLLLFLADGAAPQGVGATGAALGYACKDSSAEGAESPCTEPGLPGGFAAVAIDRYGNFSLPLNGSGPGAAPDAVVVRGSGNGTTGYRYVAGAAAPFGTATEGATPRTVRVTLLPDGAGHLALTVRVEIPGGALRTVLDRVPLHGDGQAPLPSTLRLGFAASTGTFVDVHEVDELRVRVPVDLSVDQALQPTVTPGERVSYDVTAHNAALSHSDPSPLTVDVPDELTDVSWTCRGEDGGACGAASGTGDVAVDLDLPHAAGATVTVTGTVPAEAQGRLTSTATIAPASGLQDTYEDDDVSTVSTEVDRDDTGGPEPVAEAQVATEKSVSPATGVHPGDEVAYRITVRNDGPGTAEDVGATDELPAAMRFSGSDDDCTASGQLVTCRSTDDLAPGGRRDFVVRAVLDEDYRGDGSDVVNVATASSATDPDGGDPSPAVPIGVEQGGDGDGDGGGPGQTASPTPAAPGGAGHTPGPAAAGSPSTGRGGALAYTGADGLGALGVLAGVGVLTGGGVWWAARRRRPSTADAVSETGAP
ncbi:DUF11 domain-containing protein [Curtobacterium sp. MCBA15_012]|uniref:lectin-like domain-containing protein n=1 Tax=Curtobacterium sp. MCBA15_012 TaxID=1898738 RepID=UPI0008DE17AE|nr:DUF11 domain-containing protein [Curtobacterium sp. MCBA15_012]WIB00549.1 DUF11 domain-containing protein [Curtobacterium sp. MCBA15_012]